MITTHNMKKMAGKALLSGSLALAALGLASGTAHAFNPQPDPPGKPINIGVNPPSEMPGGPASIGVNPQVSRPHIAAQG